ncbi:MAG TPA: SRPBCC domain-containing protein [Nocardioidaceae bacterium]|nr:SRPBCC domain-containing protein [Nocardioidaceae bacterium]
MPVIDVEKDLDNHRLTITAQFAAPVERVWQIWADPRQLETWWGPPTHPATVVEHDLAAGGSVAYYMTGPDGEKFHGWWRVTVVEPPHRLQYDDGFADAEGNPVEGAPVAHNSAELTPHEGGTRMVTTSTYATADELQKVLEMGAVEGASAAMGQIDELLAA